MPSSEERLNYMAAPMNNTPIEIVYIADDQSVFFEVLPYIENACIKDFLEKSGVLEQYPEVTWKTHSIGIFSEPCNLDTPVYPGNRIEIYRPLRIDPKARRRIKAKAKMQSASHLKKRAHS